MTLEHALHFVDELALEYQETTQMKEMFIKAVSDAEEMNCDIDFKVGINRQKQPYINMDITERKNG